MALIKADRVKETSTSTGATTFALAGAGTGYRTFSSVCAIGDTFYYAISNQSNGEWEAGLGTYSALNTLTRTAVHSSSNSGNVVTFTSGTKEVFLTLTARHLDRINDNGQSTAIGSKTSVVAVNDSATLPDLDLQFSELKTLTAKYGPTPSYSRASTGTYFNASGVLTSAAVNEPRFDHVLENGVWVSKGLLIEEQRTNLCTYSEQLDHASWNFLTNITVSSNASAAPDGTITADLIYPTASGANCEIGKAVGTVSLSPVIYTNSYYLKSSGKIWARILSIRGDYGAWFNLSNGTIGTTLSGSVATIQNVGNGWYRCTVARTTDFSTGYTFVKISDSDNSNTVTASGTDGILVWGAQVELGSFPTSYIPTVASSVTRSADVCQITGSAFTNLWNATEGSFSVDWDVNWPFSSGSTGVVIYCNDGTTNNRFLINNDASGNNNNRFYINNNGFSDVSQLFNGTTSGYTSGTRIRYAAAYKVNDFAFSTNGLAVTSDTSQGVPSFTQMTIGDYASSQNINGHIARLRYFRSRLDNTQLVNLSGGINTLAFKPVTGSGSVTVANEYSGINISVPNPLPITNGGTGGTTAVSGAVNLIKSAPNDGAEYTLKSKQISGAPSFYWVDSTGYAPTLDLLFAADKSLTAYTGPTPSFSRASTGTFFNSSGTLTTAAVNGPRFNHVYNGSSWVSKGLLVEEQRTNLATYSEDFSNAAYGISGVTVLANQVAAPDGNTTADKLTMTSSGTFYQSPLYGSAGAQAGSVWLRADSTQTVMLRIANDSGGESTTSTVTVTTSWQRFSVARTFAANPIKIWFGIDQRSVLGGPNVAATIYGWGYQIESGAFPTSYIPTTTAAVTRSADVCQITGSDFSGFYNQTEGSFAVNYDCPANGTLVQYQANSAASTNIHTAVSIGTTQYFQVYLPPEQALINAGSIVANLPQGLSSAYKLNDFAASLNGGAVATDTSGSLPTPTKIIIGADGSAYVNGHIARLRYYPTRLPNATLQVLST